MFNETNYLGRLTRWSASGDFGGASKSTSSASNAFKEVMSRDLTISCQRSIVEHIMATPPASWTAICGYLRQ